MYKLTNYTSIIRTTDGASIPPDLQNTDYANYLIWVSEGNIPKPVDIPPEPTYRELRAAAYPPLTDLADAVAKGGKALKDYQMACMAVKDKYPGPIA